MPTKRPLIRFRDIIENGQAVLNYKKGMDFTACSNSSITRDASERCFARISEASIKLGSTAEELFPKHDWRSIRGLGNILRPEYEDILDEILWKTVTDRRPPLLVELEAFLAQYPENQETL